MTKGSDSAAPGSPWRRLETLAAQAKDRSAQRDAELERRRGQPAEPGDLFVLPATAELAVEWAILERQPGARGKLLAVPADTRPLAGTADVEVAENDAGGPLSLRCRFAVWLDSRVFDPALRSGALAPAVLAEARNRFRQVASGTLEPSPLAEEVDADPEYQDWIREVPERARTLVLATPRPVVKRFPGGPAGPAYALAAMFALMTIGLSIWVVQLRGRVDQLPGPVFVPSGLIELGQDTRGESVIQVPREASHVLFVLAVDPSLGARDGYVEIVRHSQPVWRSSRVRLTAPGGLNLMVPHRLLPNGYYVVQLYPESGFDAHPLAKEVVRIERAE